MFSIEAFPTFSLGGNEGFANGDVIMLSKSTWSYKSIGTLTRLIATKLSPMRTMKFAWMLGILSIAYRRQTFTDLNGILHRECTLHIMEIEVLRRGVLLHIKRLHLCLPWLSAQRTSYCTSSRLCQLWNTLLSASCLLEQMEDLQHRINEIMTSCLLYYI
jgi:hypothetical protein